VKRSKANVADSKRAARSQRRRKQTRDEILDAARDVVLREGLLGFSLTAVADELGLTKPALYYYFASKEALIFEAILRELVASAEEVHAAVEKTENGADAIETLIRTVFARYTTELDLFMLVYMTPPSGAYHEFLGPDQLQRIRPINDLWYGGAEERLIGDQKAGIFPKNRDARRFAFTAHTAVIGLLNMRAMTDAFSDPLIHSDIDLVDDLCRTYREAATRGNQ
jgi:AcrR family transcriptional regulator